MILETTVCHALFLGRASVIWNAHDIWVGHLRAFITVNPKLIGISAGWRTLRHTVWCCHKGVLLRLWFSGTTCPMPFLQSTLLRDRTSTCLIMSSLKILFHMLNGPWPKNLRAYSSETFWRTLSLKELVHENLVITKKLYSLLCFPFYKEVSSRLLSHSNFCAWDRRHGHFCGSEMVEWVSNTHRYWISELLPLPSTWF